MGNGWGPSVLDNTMELKFIKQAQKGFDNNRSYWISGTTNVAARRVFDFNSLINGDSGDLLVRKKHCSFNS